MKGKGVHILTGIRGGSIHPGPEKLSVLDDGELEALAAILVRRTGEGDFDDLARVGTTLRLRTVTHLEQGEPGR